MSLSAGTAGTAAAAGQIRIRTLAGTGPPAGMEARALAGLLRLRSTAPLRLIPAAAAPAAPAAEGRGPLSKAARVGRAATAARVLAVWPVQACPIVALLGAMAPAVRAARLVV